MAFHPNGFAIASTSTLSPSNGDFPSHVLSSSMSSFSSPAAGRHSSQGQMNKIYKQASNLFLTRRYPEALSTVLPLITPPHGEGSGSTGDTNNLEQPDQNGHLEEPAPVATASRTMRTKVWCLYLTLLNAILEMEPDQGKDAFGAQWKALCAKVRDGVVWEEVVRNGYHGGEGDVDSEVVISLATLLLAHARSQALNQKRLETYLTSCTVPNLDFPRRMSGSVTPRARSSDRYMSPSKGSRSGADTPRDLNTRVKILELYTLHVLRKNREWECAREFIAASPFLDEERRDAFLMALQSLQELDEEEERKQREEMETEQEKVRREVEEARKLRAENEVREQMRLQEERKQRHAHSKSQSQGSEVDYGIDGAPASGSSRSGKLRGRRPSSPRPALSRPANRKGGEAVSISLVERATMIMRQLQGVVDQLGMSLQTNPTSLMKVVSFVIMLLLMFARRDLRERIQRILAASWAKVKATAGMGVKVSYI